MHHIVGHQFHGLFDLLLGRGPGEDAIDLVDEFLVDAAGLHDVGLLPQVLGDQFARVVQSLLAVVVHGAHHQLGAVDVVDAAARALGADFQVLHGHLVVLGRDQVIEEHTVRDFPGQFHHLHARGANVDGHIARALAPVHHVQHDIGDVDELTVKRDPLRVEQAADNRDNLPHGLEGPATVYTYFTGQRFPPGPDAQHNAVGSQVVQGEERAGNKGGVARPAVDDATAHFDVVGHRGVGGHGHDGVTHQARLRLPDRLESLLLRVLDVGNRLGAQVMLVLHVEGNALFRHGGLLMRWVLGIGYWILGRNGGGASF